MMHSGSNAGDVGRLTPIVEGGDWVPAKYSRREGETDGPVSPAEPSLRISGWIRVADTNTLTHSLGQISSPLYSTVVIVVVAVTLRSFTLYLMTRPVPNV